MSPLANGVPSKYSPLSAATPYTKLTVAPSAIVALSSVSFTVTALMLEIAAALGNTISS